MSNREVLKMFARQPVTLEMVDFLAATTCSVIQVKQLASAKPSLILKNVTAAPVRKDSVSLTRFITRLIECSNVQTPTLMASLVYLTRLRNILPGNAVGIETTRHRIFLASLILAAKSLNDSSPMNKHWTRYTDGLLSLQEVNSSERELIALLKWNITIKEDDLISVLQPFLATIRRSLQKKLQSESIAKSHCYRMSSFSSLKSLASVPSRSSSKTSIFSDNTLPLNTPALSSYSLASTALSARSPFAAKSSASLNLMRTNNFYRTKDASLAKDHLLPPAVV